MLITGKVCKKSAVGFGPPEIVSVDAPPTAALALAELLTDELASRMVKRGEMAYMPPCVELMKRR